MQIMQRPPAVNHLVLGRHRLCIAPLDEAALSIEHSWFTGEYNGSQLPTLSQCWDSVWSEPVLSQSHVHGSCCVWKMWLPWGPLQPLPLTIVLPPVWNRSLHPEGRGLTTILKYR